MSEPKTTTTEQILANIELEFKEIKKDLENVAPKAGQ